MKRRRFLKSLLSLPALPLSLKAGNGNPVDAGNQLYEMREYTLRWGSLQRQLDAYFKTALIPSLNKLGVNPVGVFTERGNPEPAKCYLLIPHAGFNAYNDNYQSLKKDAEFAELAKAFHELPPEKSVYTRYDTRLMLAFDRLPAIESPPSGERIFELRTYEGYNDNAVDRKVKMFNVEEIDLFYKTRLNPVFFGKHIAGKDMPALSYMLWFKNYEEREANWKTFIKHEEWAIMSRRAEYANSVSNVIRTFLEPRDYSQI